MAMTVPPKKTLVNKTGFRLDCPGLMEKAGIVSFD